MTPRERRDWPWVRGALALVIGFILMSLAQWYFGG
jgi:hypothetical protein